eukprot:2689199-Amphidinium_carterae.1
MTAPSVAHQPAVVYKFRYTSNNKQQQHVNPQIWRSFSSASLSACVMRRHGSACTAFMAHSLVHGDGFVPTEVITSACNLG